MNRLLYPFFFFIHDNQLYSRIFTSSQTLWNQTFELKLLLSDIGTYRNSKLVRGSSVLAGSVGRTVSMDLLKTFMTHITWWIHTNQKYLGGRKKARDSRRRVCTCTLNFQGDFLAVGERMRLHIWTYSLSLSLALSLLIQRQSLSRSRENILPTLFDLSGFASSIGISFTIIIKKEGIQD